MSAELAIVRSPAEEAIAARYPAFKASQSHWGGALVARLRDEGFAAFKSGGLPNRRVEEWKYTDLRALMRDLPDRPAPNTEELLRQAQTLRSPLSAADATRILFVNGEQSATLKDKAFLYGSLRQGDEQAVGMADAVKAARPYADNTAVALNAMFMDDWTLLRVPKGTALAAPLHLEFRDIADKPHSTFPRVLVVVEDGASATVIETHDGPDGVAYHTNALIEFEVGAGARVEHIRLNAAGDAALTLSTLGVKLGQEAQFSSVSMTTGAGVSRHQVFLQFTGSNAQGFVRGATMLRGRQHHDSTLVIDHQQPHCVSREIFKTVLDDQARGIFQGKIIVRPHAQKTDGKMAANALLLSEEAEADAKPELEIFADDVQCGHGATVGDLDEDLLFYLRSRGIPSKEAEALLIQAFIGEAVESVEHVQAREALIDVAVKWLGERG